MKLLDRWSELIKTAQKYCWQVARWREHNTSRRQTWNNDSSKTFPSTKFDTHAHFVLHDSYHIDRYHHAKNNKSKHNNSVNRDGEFKIIVDLYIIVDVITSNLYRNMGIHVDPCDICKIDCQLKKTMQSRKR